MKIIIKTVALACLVFASCTSEKKENTPTAENSNITEKPLLAQVEATSKNFAPTYFYVNAASGLSLRTSTNLKSKKFEVFSISHVITFSGPYIIPELRAFICFRYLILSSLVDSPILKDESQKLINILDPAKSFLVIGLARFLFGT